MHSYVQLLSLSAITCASRFCHVPFTPHSYIFLVTLSRNHRARSRFSVTEKMIWNHVKKLMRMNLESLLNPPLDKWEMRNRD